jgi:hypothetical protein
MFLVLSDLAVLTRKELTIDTTTPNVLTSGVQGSWVTISGSNSTAFLTSGATALAWPVFNESKRDQTAGAWAPDVLNTGKVTILTGKYFARTSVYSGSPAVGQPLDCMAGGLIQGASGTATNVGFCIKAPYSYNYLGYTFNVIDIYVI